MYVQDDYILVLTMMREKARKRNYLSFISHVKDFELAIYTMGKH